MEESGGKKEERRYRFVRSKEMKRNKKRGGYVCVYAGPKRCLLRE